MTPVFYNPSAAPKVAILLPLAFLAHLAEEWFGAFLDWTPVALGYKMSAERFVLINATAFVVFAAGTISSLRYPRMAWFAASLAVLLGLNGVLHALGTAGFRTYSPGTITGLILYVPLSIILLRWAATELPGLTLGLAIETVKFTVDGASLLSGGYFYHI